MKAIVKMHDGKNGWEIVDKERIAPGDDEVEMKVMSAGICGSELHLWHDNHFYDPGTVVGHEFSGVIERVGKNVTEWKPGDRIITENRFTGCGSCEYCRNGNMAMCKKIKAMGYRYDGGWRNYINLPTKQLIRIPDNVSYDEAAMVEPSAVLVEALCVKHPVHCGDRVLIQGCGQMGLIGLMVAKAAGAGEVYVTGTDLDEAQRMPLARELGADRTINVQREELQTVVNELTGGKGVDYIVDCSGAPSALRAAFDIIKRAGTIVAIGEAPADMVEIPWNKGIFKATSLFFHFGSDYLAWRLVLDLQAHGKLQLKKLITHDISMADYRKGFDLLDKKESIKIMMHPIQEGY